MRGDLAQRVMLMELAVWGLLLNDAFDEVERAQKRSDHWQLQPRVPEGHPEGGRWTDGGHIPAAAPLIITAAVKVAARLVATMRRFVITEMSKVPMALPLPVPPLLQFGDHFRLLPSLRRKGIPYMEFDHYDQYKYVFGVFGMPYQWHHIVEQRMANPNRLSTGLVFPPRSVHNTDNLILLPKVVHECISRHYGGRYTASGGRSYSTLRSYLEDKPWSYHYLIGIDYIRRCQRETGRRRITGSRRRAR